MEQGMSSSIGHESPAKLDNMLEEHTWRARDQKRRSVGSASSNPGAWRAASTDGVFPSRAAMETCSLDLCEQMACPHYASSSTSATPCPCPGCRPPSTPGMTHKKGASSRSSNGDMLKRYRVQAGYEMSQDLLEKQVEMLERKYGGAKARRAALVIQRAFRRYKLVKKFAAITAMAKAEKHLSREKRLSRRFQVDLGSNNGNGNNSPVEWSPSHQHYQPGSPHPSGISSQPQGSRSTVVYLQSNAQYHHCSEVSTDSQSTCEQCMMNCDPEMVIRNQFASLYRELRENSESRPPRPVRSMSMRERRAGSVSGAPTAVSNAGSLPCDSDPLLNQTHPILLPRSQSAGVTHQPTTASGQAASPIAQLGAAIADIDLNDRELPSYSQFDEYSVYYTATSLAPCHHHFQDDHDVYNLQMDPSGSVAYIYPPTTKEAHPDQDMSRYMMQADSTNNMPYLVQSTTVTKETHSDDAAHGYNSQNMHRESIMKRVTTVSPMPPAWARKDSQQLHGGVRVLTSSAEWGPQGNKKVPPEVPKRTTSILSRSRSAAESAPTSSGTVVQTQGHSRGNSLLNGSVNIVSADTVSLSSSDSSLSLSSTRQESADVSRDANLWQRKGQTTEMFSDGDTAEQKESPLTVQLPHATVRALMDPQTPIYKVSETVRKRQYRVGLNLFNKKPERGITHLIRRGFLEKSPQGVARFLITRKGLSKQMIGEYLGTLQDPFNMAVLECFAQELVFSGMHIDVALRKFLTYFRMPGEAQKIERLMEVFGQRYCQCNSDVAAQFHSADTIFVLAFAIIMLNTDLHTPNLKPERRMKLDEFIKNLRGIDDGADIDKDFLTGIYDRIKHSEFKPGSDHVTQVMKVQSTIGGKKPNLALPHRRLVCYCRLYEIPDVHKKERPGVHQREVFLFNDLLVITKIFSKKKSSVAYSFRQSFTLCGMMVSTFETQYYQYGIKLSQRLDGKTLLMFNARNEHDRCKFAEDLRESICEMDEMESIRIEAELERQKSGRRRAVAEDRDSGVIDVEVSLSPTASCMSVNTGSTTTVVGVISTSTTTLSSTAPEECKQAPAPEVVTGDQRGGSNEGLKRSALSNSLLDIHDQFSGEKPQRRGSVGSLDSGMSISFQSTSASTVSRDSSPQNIQPCPGTSGSNVAAPLSKPGQPSKSLSHQQSFLGGLFHKKERKASRTDEVNPYSRITEV